MIRPITKDNESDNVVAHCSSPHVDRLNAHSHDGDRWPLRYCILFILFASLLLWTAIVVLGHAVVAAL